MGGSKLTMITLFLLIVSVFLHVSHQVTWCVTRILANAAFLASSIVFGHVSFECPRVQTRIIANFAFEGLLFHFDYIMFFSSHEPFEKNRRIRLLMQFDLFRQKNLGKLSLTDEKVEK